MAPASIVKVVLVAPRAEGVDVTIMYDGPPGDDRAAPPPALTVDGAKAASLGPATAAHSAWTIVWDAQIAEKERFRDARQVALYFATGLPPGDLADVIVLRGEHEPLVSGWGGVEDLVRLRAPIDATLDPTKTTSSDADLFVPDAGAPPNAGSLRAVRVDVRAGVPGDVRIDVSLEAGASVGPRLAVETGRAQKDGPRIAADVRARVAKTAIATWHAAHVGPDANGHDLVLGTGAESAAARHVAPFGVPDARGSSDAGEASQELPQHGTTSVSLPFVAVALGAIGALVVWRVRRRG